MLICFETVFLLPPKKRTHHKDKLQNDVSFVVNRMKI